VILYFDKQRLARDCISEQLAIHLPEWTIEPLASVCELREDEDWSRASLAIFNTHGESLRNADVAREIAMIAKAAAGSSLVIMSEISTMRRRCFWRLSLEPGAIYRLACRSGK
jgi:hypothetical protein